MSKQVNMSSSSLYKAIFLQAERVSTGEEVTFHYVESVLEVAIEQWNMAIKGLHDHNERDLLASMDEGFSATRSIEDHLEEFSKRLSELRPIALTRSSSNFLKLYSNW